ncbi:uncharacterized protein LOC103524116 [Trichonephila clavipes]|nr:uncharacterized protein LOC103524116 [Trichonephila clavipes]
MTEEKLIDHKTQKGFIQCVRENIQYKVINDVPFELLSFANPLDYAILNIRLDLVRNVRKRDLSPTALHAIALETINTHFPPEEWFHIYTDGSLLDFAQGAGIGVFSHLFSFYLHAGPLTTHFDGEVEAIHIALQQLAVRLPPIKRAVILLDSTSAFQALSNYNENNCLRVQNCRELLGKIKGKIVFQWNFRRDLTLHSAKLEIKRIFRESFRLTASRVVRDKPWSTLCKKSHGIPSSPRAAAVAKFRLLTGHDCLCAHLFRFNLVTSPICVLCDTGQDMTAAHLDECSALNDLYCIVKSRLEPQVLDYVEVRNPQTTSNLLQIIDKYEERFLNRKIRGSSWESRDIEPNENNRFPNRNRQENWRKTRGNNRYAVKIVDHGESSIDLRVKVLWIIRDSMVDAEVVNRIIDSTIKAIDRVVQGIVLSGVRMIETDI